MAPGSFTAFPPSTAAFYRDLEQNNDRAWFEDHKERFIREVRDPSLAFIEAMGPRLAALAPAVQFDTRTNGAGSLMRIYRDTRFSKDKTPYKTNLGIIFWEGPGKKMECPGFYFHLEAGSIGFYGGLYRFTDAQIDTYRAALVNDRLGAELDDVLNELRALGPYRVGGSHLKTVPRGFDPDHPRADLLKHNGLYAGLDLDDPGLVSRPEFMDVAFEHWRVLAPLHHWLVRHVA